MTDEQDEAPAITREEFIRGYCERSKVTWEELSKRRKAMRCYCGDPICKGWQMVPLDYVYPHLL